MILVRTSFHAAFGKGPELAGEVTSAMTNLVTGLDSGSGWRVLSGITGSTDTGVVEVQEANLAAWEARQAPMMKQPDFGKAFAAAASLIESSGSAEFLSIAGAS